MIFRQQCQDIVKSQETAELFLKDYFPYYSFQQLLVMTYAY